MVPRDGLGVDRKYALDAVLPQQAGQNHRGLRFQRKGIFGLRKERLDKLPASGAPVFFAIKYQQGNAAAEC